MAGPELKLTIVGEDKSASKALKGVGDAAQGTQKKLGGFGSSLKGALAVGAVVAFGKASVDAFADAEQSQQKLQDAFDRFPKLADSSVQSIQALGTALSKKTKFDDDAVASGAAVLAQFDLTGKQIEEVLPLVADYAAKTGQDLPSAAGVMGKAFLGNAKALKTIGVNFKATGDRGKDFSAIVGLLGDKVGGFAEKQGKTAAGQMEILKNQFGEAQEALGGALVPALTSATKIIIPMVTAAGNLIGIIGKLPTPVIAAGAAFVGWLKFGPKITGFFRDAETGASNFGSKMKSLGKSIGTGGAFLAVGLVVDSLGKSYENAKPKVTDFTEAIDANTGALAENGAAATAMALAQSGAFDQVKNLGVSTATYTDAVMGNVDAKKELSKAFEAAAKDADGDIDKTYLLARALGQASADTKGFASEQEHGKQVAEANAAAQRKANDQLQAAADKADLSTGAMARNGRAAVDTESQIAKMKDTIARSQAPVDHLADALDAQSKASDGADKSLQFLQLSLDKLAHKDRDAEAATRANAAAMRGITADARAVGAAKDDVAQATEDLTAAQKKETSATYTGAQKARDIRNAERALKDAKDGVKDATDRLADSQDTASKSAAGQVDAVFQATLKTKGYSAAVRAARGEMRAQRKAFIDSEIAAGRTRAEAEKLADAQGLIDRNVSTTYSSNAYSEAQNVDRLKQRIDVLPSGKTISIYVNQINSGGAAHSGTGYSTGLAEGGAVSGGIPNRDSVPIWGMPGEHMLTKEDVSALGGQSAVYAWRKSLHSGGKFTARGGAASPATGAPLVVNINVTGAVVADKIALAKMVKDSVGLARRNGAIVGAF